MIGHIVDIDPARVEHVAKAIAGRPSAWRFWKAEARAALLADEAWRAGQTPRYRHRKTGGTYALIGDGRMQTAEPVGDMTHVVVYRSEKDGLLWVRPVAEFEDGRFDPASSPPDPTPPAVGITDEIRAAAREAMEGAHALSLHHRQPIMAVGEWLVMDHAGTLAGPFASEAEAKRARRRIVVDCILAAVAPLIRAKAEMEMQEAADVTLEDEQAAHADTLRLWEFVKSRAEKAERERDEALALVARLNSGEELQALMATNNALRARLVALAEGPTEAMLEAARTALRRFIESLTPEQRASRALGRQTTFGFLVHARVKYTVRYRAMIAAALKEAGHG